MISDTPHPENELFDGGPPLKLETRLGLARPGHRNCIRRAVLVALLAWLPLALLAVVQSLLLHMDGWDSFASDIAVHARFLIAAPLLVLAEAICIPRLGAIARHFIDAGLVRSAERARFDSAIASTRRLRDSTLAEIVVIALAYAVVACLVYAYPLGGVPPWHRTDAGFSPAGWWHALVSVPLLLVLFLGWMWRLFLWTRLLWLVSRLDLHLVPSHPDRAAGLAFVGYSARAWSILGFALGTVVAGMVASGIALRGATLLGEQYMIIGVVLCAFVLFAGPLLIFTGKLLRAWRRGIFAYGALADEFGQQFERKWLARAQPLDESVLEKPDFSAATDLYQVVDRVHDMRLVPVDWTSLLILAIATLLPFAPVALMEVSLDAILAQLAALLF